MMRVIVMKKILIIEDNEQLCRYLCEYLRAYDYQPIVLADYDALIKTVSEMAPKLILLDIELPKFDGFYYLKQIQKFDAQIPVIILSASSGEAEQIRGIENGAYDYITKPFSIGVLLAKITALLGRNEQTATKLQVGQLSLSHTTLALANGELIVDLSKNEYKIMSLLLSMPNQFISREKILEALWDDTYFVDDNTLTVNISRLKKKLNEIGIHEAIVTKRGVGYAFMENH